MDKQKSDSLRHLLEGCLQNKNEAWRELFSRYQELIQRTLGRGQAPHVRSAFLEWFPGWLCAEQKLRTAYNTLLRGQKEGSGPAPEIPEKDFENYLRWIVRSGIAEFFEEIGAAEAVLLPDVPETASTAANTAFDEEEREQVRAALRDLDPDQRIPFWLRHYWLCGPVEDADLSWIAKNRVGLAPEAIRAKIEETVATNQGRKSPLSSRFIAALLDIPPNSVDKRIQRVLDKLQSRFRGWDEEGNS